MLDPKSTIHSDIAMFTSYGMSAAEERVRSSLSITKFELKTYSVANKFMGLHTGVDKLDRYGWRKTVSSKGGDILKGNLRYFS